MFFDIDVDFRIVILIMIFQIFATLFSFPKPIGKCQNDDIITSEENAKLKEEEYQKNLKYLAMKDLEIEATEKQLIKKATGFLKQQKKKSKALILKNSKLKEKEHMLIKKGEALANKEKQLLKFQQMINEQLKVLQIKFDDVQMFKENVQQANKVHEHVVTLKQLETTKKKHPLDEDIDVFLELPEDAYWDDFILDSMWMPKNPKVDNPVEYEMERHMFIFQENMERLNEKMKYI